jgi:type IV secretion system protein VirB1
MARRCAIDVHPETMKAVVTTESSHNPYAVGVVGGRLSRQPRNLDEALQVVSLLESQSYNYSLGISQVNKKNLSRLGLDVKSAFDPCKNLKGGSKILKECFQTAKGRGMNDKDALQAALSCYYSGNFTTGKKLGYVDKVLGVAAKTEKQKSAIRVIKNMKGGEKEHKSDAHRQKTKEPDRSFVF